MGQTISTHPGPSDVGSETAIRASVDDDKQHRLKRITQSLIGLTTLPTVITRRPLHAMLRNWSRLTRR